MHLATKDELCSGCRVCELVCSLQNFKENNPKLALMKVAGRYPTPGGYVVGVCDECGLCREVCPAEAISSVDGHLQVDPELCIACWACVDVCPPGVMTLHQSWKSPHKCYQCGACAEYCPTGAIYDADQTSPDQARRITRSAVAAAQVGGAGND